MTAFYFPSLGKDMQCSLKQEKGFQFFPLAMYSNLSPMRAVYLLAD